MVLDSKYQEYVSAFLWNNILSIFISTLRFSEFYRNCTIIDVPTDYSPKSIAYAFPLDSPYLGPFNHILQQMKQTGIIDKIKEKYAGQAQVSLKFIKKIHILFLQLYIMQEITKI